MGRWYQEGMHVWKGIQGQTWKESPWKWWRILHFWDMKHSFQLIISNANVDSIMCKQDIATPTSVGQEPNDPKGTILLVWSFYLVSTHFFQNLLIEKSNCLHRTLNTTTHQLWESILANSTAVTEGDRVYVLNGKCCKMGKWNQVRAHCTSWTGYVWVGQETRPVLLRWRTPAFGDTAWILAEGQGHS